MTCPLAPRVRAWQRPIVTIATIVLASSSASSQGVDRSRPPQAPAARRIVFPSVHMPTVLSNGLRIYVVEDHSVPVVSVRVVMAADSTFDPAGKEGLYAVTLGALAEGTSSRSADQLAAAAADIGTRVTPAGFTTTTALFPRALALLADMLVRPSLDSAAVQRRKAVQSALARRVAQSPVTIPRHLFYAMLYGTDAPYVRSLVPSEASVASITTSDAAALYASQFRPDRTSIVIAGDVEGADAVRQAGRAFESWLGHGAVAAPLEKAAVAARPTAIYLYDAPGPQAYVYVGAAGPARTSPDSYAADAMGAIALVRFQQALRDRRSFMYSGATGFTWRRASRPSAFVGSTVVAASKVDSALVEWLAILRGLRGAAPISATELAAAQRSRVGALAARMDGADSLSARLAEIVRDSLPLDFWDRYAARLSTLTTRDVAAAATRVIDPEHLVIVVVGDRNVIEPALRAANIAPVVVVDASGRPLAPER
jgi:zinc protease